MGRRPYISARTGPEGLLGSRLPPECPKDWTALSVDGSHIDVDRHLPLRYHLINLGGCIIPTLGRYRVPSIGAGRLDTLRHGDFLWATGSSKLPRSLQVTPFVCNGSLP